jgi:hypothetical protein
LLQGIDGRFVRFAVAQSIESGKVSDDAGQDEIGENEDVVGIDIVADEARVRDMQQWVSSESLS